MERCPTQAVLPLVGLAAEKVIRDRYKPIVRPSGRNHGRRRHGVGDCNLLTYCLEALYVLTPGSSWRPAQRDDLATNRRLG
ncbi:MAG: hypothetical protein ACQESR_23090 [Planctomycetota bacterium]